MFELSSRLRRSAIATVLLLGLLPALLVGPAYGKIRKGYIVLTTTGSAQQVTTAHVYTRKVTFQSKLTNTGTVYVATDSAISASSGAIGLSPGATYTPQMSELREGSGEQWDLSDWYALDATASETISVSYERYIP